MKFLLAIISISLSIFLISGYLLQQDDPYLSESEKLVNIILTPV